MGGRRNDQGEDLERVRRERDDLLQAFLQSPVGFALLDEQFRIIRINAALAAVTGLAPDVCVAQSLSCLGDVIGPAMDSLARRAAEAGRQVHNEEVVEQRDGSARYWLVSAYRSALQSGWHVALIAREITEIRRLEDRLRRAERLEAVGRLAAGTAHDFNNLLTGVIGNLSLAAESLPAGHPSHRFLDDGLAASQKAANLVSRLLEYAGKSTLFTRRVNLNKIVRDALNCVERPPHIELELSLMQHAPEIEADPEKIQIAIESLLANAYEAIGEQPGVVRVASGTESHSGALYAVITIEDTGEGMEPDTLAKIFEPFFSTRFIGRGLGLPSALGILRSHGGSIEVSSAAGAGARFRVCVPVPDVPVRQ